MLFYGELFLNMVVLFYLGQYQERNHECLNGEQWNQSIVLLQDNTVSNMQYKILKSSCPELT